MSSPDRGPDAAASHLASGVVHADPRRSRVGDVLGEAILQENLRAGVPLVECVVADQLQVSRAPGREATRALAKGGLVASRPYRGSRVREGEPGDVEELHGLRRTLDVFAVERTAGRRPEGVVARLYAPCDDTQVLLREPGRPGAELVLDAWRADG